MAMDIVDQASFQREVVESEQPVVVDFYADWCAPCRALAPILESLSERWQGRVKFVKVDVDDNPQLAETYRVSSIPAIARFEGGGARRWVVGSRPPRELERELGLVDDEEGDEVGPRRAVDGIRRWWSGQ